jgi:hypothetical protein
MKEATTPYSKAIQENMQINRKFLESKGWVIKQEFPLCDQFKHSKSTDLLCSIGLYGGFSIVELHWCNKTPEKEFSTINPDLTTNDYETIIRLLKLNI